MLSEIRSLRVKIVVTFWFPLVCTGSLDFDTLCVWHRFFNASWVGGFDSAFLSPFVREELRHISVIFILYQNPHLLLLSPYNFIKTPLVFFIWHNFTFSVQDIKNKTKLLLILMIYFLSNSVLLLLAVHLSLFTMFAMLLFVRTKVINSLAALVALGAFFLYLHSCFLSSFIVKLVKFVFPEKGQVVGRAEFEVHLESSNMCMVSCMQETSLYIYPVWSLELLSLLLLKFFVLFCLQSSYHSFVYIIPNLFFYLLYLAFS